MALNQGERQVDGRRVRREVMRSVLVVLMVIAAVALLAAAIVDRSVHRHNSAAAEVNLAGSQRMLVSNIHVAALELADADSLQAQDHAMQDLRAATTRMRTQADTLIDGSDTTRGLVELNSDVRQTYDRPPYDVTRRTTEFLDVADQVLALPFGDPGIESLLEQIGGLATLAEDDIGLIEALEQAVLSRQEADEADLRRTEQLTLGLAGLVLMVIGATAIFLVWPMTKRLGALIDECNHREDELTQVIEGARVGLVTFDHDGKVQTANSTAESMLGRRPDTIAEILPMADGLDESAWRWSWEGHSRKVVQTSDVQTPTQLDVFVTRVGPEHNQRHIAVLSDITELETSQRNLVSLIEVDAVTGLHSFLKFSESVESRLGTLHDETMSLLVLGMVDLEEMRQSIGVAAADDLMRAAADQLRDRSSGVTDLISFCRLSESAFGLAFIGSEESARELAEELVLLPAQTTTEDGIRLTSRVVCGTAVAADGTKTAMQLVNEADLARRRAHWDGQLVVHFEERLVDDAKRSMILRSDLPQALSSEQLDMRFLPQFDLETGSVTGVEALVRWTHHKYGPISPPEINQLASEANLLDQYTSWTVSRALDEAETWGNGEKPLEVAINVTVDQVVQPGFVDAVLCGPLATVSPRVRLTLEVMADAFLDPSGSVERHLLELWGRGVSICADGFGESYSSLGLLQGYAINQVKLGRSVVDALGFEPDQKVLVGGIVELSNALGYTVVASGVELAIQATALRDLGIERVQGHLYSKDLGSDDVGPLIDRVGIADLPPLEIAMSDPLVSA